MIKGYLTDKGFEAAVNAQQVFGGHGYIREWGMEQFVRDARIAQIYEGTNGIQAMDLVGRKLAKDGGRGVRAFFETVGARHRRRQGRRAIRPGVAEPLEKALGDLQAATMWLAQNGMADPNNAGAGAYAYMQLMGLVASAGCGSRWPRRAARLLAERRRGPRPSTRPSWSPRASSPTASWSPPGRLRRKVEAGAESVMALPVEAF